ncbi:MAG: hypothetical protein NWE89_04730 [Candidatus Bathyarchaeota archaeon]|nr:hypothetical protein [Candidatus Bathyarchaeota archaeon]
MPIDRALFEEDYKKGTSQNADKLVRNFVNKKGKLEASKSDAAENLWKEKILLAAEKKKRQKALGRITEEDLNAGMLATGATAYRNKTAAKAAKMLKNVEPYLKAIDGLEGNYPARTADPMENLMNRAGLVVMTLHNLKKELTE